VTHHFEYAPLGVLVSEDSTDINLEEGLTLRTDGDGHSYCRNENIIYFMGDYP
jgi:hypothetical protein